VTVCRYNPTYLDQQVVVSDQPTLLRLQNWLDRLPLLPARCPDAPGGPFSNDLLMVYDRDRGSQVIGISYGTCTVSSYSGATRRAGRAADLSAIVPQLKP
jgi:hypothetical protein